MARFALSFPRIAHMGHNVSHAKNRTQRSFKYNLHTVTVIMDGVKQRLRVPAKIIRQLKKAGVTTHYRAEA
jgi:ribosomal protein L28